MQTCLPLLAGDGGVVVPGPKPCHVPEPTIMGTHSHVSSCTGCWHRSGKGGRDAVPCMQGLCHSVRCCILWHRLCLGCGRDGYSILHALGAGTVGLGVASRGWQWPDSCAVASVVAPAHELTLAFLPHQPQGSGHQPAWDCAQCQDTAVRVTPASHGGVPGQGNSLRPNPDQAPFSCHFQLPRDAGGRRQRAC